MKKPILIGLGVLALLVLGGLGYWIFQNMWQKKQAEMACVATSFPYLIMEHKRSELSGVLDKLQLKEGEDPDPEELNKAIQQQSEEKTKSKKFYFSEEIDTEMLDLADSIQEKGPGSMTADEMTGHLERLSSLFRSQATAYLSECTSLFKKIVMECGDFEDNSTESQDCRMKYNSQITTLLQNYIK